MSKPISKPDSYRLLTITVDPDRQQVTIVTPLTLRDLFAVFALIKIGETQENAAIVAYEVADAMMVQRDRW